MGLFDFFKKRREERERQELLRQIEEEEAKRKLEELLAPKKWPWEERMERRAERAAAERAAAEQRAKDSKVHTTGHLLLTQHLVTDAVFAFKHTNNTSKYPNYMWVEKELYLGEEQPNFGYVIPFLWMRTMAKKNMPKFNKAMDLLNNEYQIDVQGCGVEEMIQRIRRNAFKQFQPSFDVNANQSLISQFYKDCECLLRLISFVGDNLKEEDILPSRSKRVNIADASHALNELINEMLDAYRIGLFDVPNDNNKKKQAEYQQKEVKDIVISGGITYSGMAISDGDKVIPHGVGICKYADHNESGIFNEGALSGLAYLNYHNYMYIGMCNSQKKINGWGIKASKGGFQFGVFENNELKINLTPLVKIFWSRIMLLAESLKVNPVSVLKSGDIFVGVTQPSTESKLGFHFKQNGEVYLGLSDNVQMSGSGVFLHFDSDYNIKRGIFNDGVLSQEIGPLDLLQACDVDSSLEYKDFDINMNYSMKSFLFNKKKLMHIVQMGKTPYNIIVKANICELYGDTIKCDGRETQNTVWFMFPNNNQDIEDEVIAICRREDPWSPIFSDYRVEFVNNITGVSSFHQLVYKHKSCWKQGIHFNLDDYYDTDLAEYGATSL